MRELAAVISRDIYLHDPNVKWSDIVGLDHAKSLVKEAVVYPIKVWFYLLFCNTKSINYYELL